MIMKTEKAKEKWCPFSIIPTRKYGSVVGINRGVQYEPNGTNCLGEKCACWIIKNDDYGHCGLTK